MIHYTHILLATDFSADSDAIADRARQIAKRAKAQLSIVHILEHTPIVYGGDEFSVPLDVNLEELLEKQARAALTKLAGRVHISPNKQHIETGSIKKGVVDMAIEIGADLIVVGSHAQSGLDRVLGSTAHAILHAAQCDVLAVRAAE